MNSYLFKDIVVGKEGLLKGPFGSDLKKELYIQKSSKAYKVYLQENILKENNFVGEYYISEEYYNKKMSRYAVKEGDFIVTCDGTLGEIFQLKNISEKGIISSSLLRITLNNEIVDNDYFYYLFKAIIKRQLITQGNNSVLKHLPGLEVIRNHSIKLHNLTEQKKIGNILKKIDDKIKNNNKINSELENMAKTIYDYWFLQFEFPNNEGKPYKSSGGKMVWNEELKKEIPDGFKIEKLENFCRIFTGKKDVNQALEKGKYKFFSCSPNYKYSNEKIYEGKAILISGNGSYTGRTILANDAIDLYQRTYACVLKNNLNCIEYFYYTLLKFFVPIVSGGTHGSTIPYIIYDDIAKQKIIINENIIGKFKKIISPIQNKIFQLKNENEELTSLRDYLLPLLMNGQIGFKE